MLRYLEYYNNKEKLLRVIIDNTSNNDIIKAKLEKALTRISQS